MEKHRQKLKSSKPNWGDQFPGDQSVIAEARDKPIFCSPTLTASYDARASKLDALIWNGMHAESIIQPRSNVLSTKGWSIDSLLKKGKNFCQIKRVPASSRSLAKSIKHYEANGKPLVIEGWHKHKNWNRAEFTLDGLHEASGEDIFARNIHDRSDIKISLSDFISKSRTAPKFAPPEEAERLYWKDAECPSAWKEWLQDGDTIPTDLLVDGPGDLFRYRPKTELVETLMCYVGVGDTFTPCHKDLCGSSGQNLMCYTENDGSSFWFMTESSSAPQVADYFQSLKHEIDHESHVITIDELSKAPFKVYITEQKLGDLVLVPPRSCHQVVNYGGITIKTSWSRMTWKGLSTAYYHELPIYRRVCRSETYRVKSTTYYTLLGLTRELNDLLDRRKSLKSSSTSGSLSRSTTPTTSRSLTLEAHHEPLSASDAERSVEVISELSETLSLYDAIISDEYSPLPSRIDLTAHEQTTCDFCGADVFQSFFECRKCTAGESGSSDHASYVVCAGCYVEGRSCKCLIMEPMQCRPFDDLLNVRRQTVKALQAGGLQTVELEPNFKDCRSGTFRAARLLLHKRKDSVMKTTKVCTIARVHEDSHTLPFASALTCKGCHSAKCFSHILVNQRMHSTEALLFHELDKDSYHQRHLNGKKRFEDGIPILQATQKNGLRPNLQLQCVDMALKYGACRPIAPTFMSPGWYDTVVHVPRAIEHPGFLQADENPEKTSSPTPNIQPASKCSLHNKSSPTFSLEIGRRPNLAFVLVPPAPYTIPGSLHLSSVTKAAPQNSQAGSAIQKQGTVPPLDPAEATPLSDSSERKGKRKADADDISPSPSTPPAKIRRKRRGTSGDTNIATENSTMPPPLTSVIDVNSTTDNPPSDCDLHSCADVQLLPSQLTSAPGKSKRRKKAVPHETVPMKPLTRSASTVKKKSLRPVGARHFPSQLADAMNSANSDNAQPLAEFQPLHSSVNDSTLSPKISSRPERDEGKRMMMEVEPSPEPLDTHTSDFAENQPTSQTASLFFPEGSKSDEASKILTSTAMHDRGPISTPHQPDRLVALESPPSEAVHPQSTFQQQACLHTAFQFPENWGGFSANASNIRKPVGPAIPVHPAPILNQPTQPSHDPSGAMAFHVMGKVLQAVGEAFSSVQLQKPEPHQNSHVECVIQSPPGLSRRVSDYPSRSGPIFNAAREQRPFTSDQQYYAREHGRGFPYGRPAYPHMGPDFIAGYAHQRPLNRHRSGPNTFHSIPNRNRPPKYFHSAPEWPSRRPRRPSEEQGAYPMLQRQSWDRELDQTSLESVTQNQPRPSISGYPVHNSMLGSHPRRDLRAAPPQYRRQPDATNIRPYYARGRHSDNRPVRGRAWYGTQSLPGIQAGNPMEGQRRCVSETPQSGTPSSTSMNNLVRRIPSKMSLQNQSERGDRTPNANSCGKASSEDMEIRSSIEELREPSPHRSEMEDPQIWEDDYAEPDETQQPMSIPDGRTANIDGASTASPNSKPSQSRAQTPSDLTFNAWT